MRRDGHQRETFRKAVTIDWTVKQKVYAKLPVTIRWVLRKYGHPQDKQEKLEIDRAGTGGIALRGHSYLRNS